MEEFSKEIGASTVYSALQTEIDARVIARASINTSHIQVILVFVSACIALKSTYSNIDMSGRDFLKYLSFFIGALIPLVSSYYIAL